jgi:Fic family protein
MNSNLFKKSPSGRLVKTADVAWAFVPRPLPPSLDWDNETTSLLAQASLGLGQLVGLGETLPNAQLLIYPFIRREAVLSSRIEGTRSSLSDLFLFEAARLEKQSDVKEVRNYVRALEYGIERIASLRIDLNLIKELHGKLMKDIWNGKHRPGAFRREQNWIGPPGCDKMSATYIPPPVNEMNKTLHHFEKFLSMKTDIPALITASLIHYQFEAIHPFLDGNGRVGRLLIILYLHQAGVLPKPLLYISAFFENHRYEYYTHLLQVSQKGAWLSWIKFFLRGIVTQSEDGITRSRSLLQLQNEYRKLGQIEQLSPSAIQIIDLIFQRPVINITSAASVLKISFPAVSKAMNQLIAVNIIEETTGQKRNKIYVARGILKILEA